MTPEGRMHSSAVGRFLAVAMPIVLVATAGACTKETKDETKAARKVTVRKLAMESWSEVLDVPSTAMGNAIVNVFAKVPGRVTAIRNDEGAYVKAGDPLIDLDTRDLLISTRAVEGQVEMARAGLVAAEVNRDNLAKDVGRFTELRKTGSVPITEADKLDAALKAAEAQVGIAKAQLDVALSGQEMSRRNLSDASVKAPVDGLIAKRSVDVGQETSPAAAIPLVILVAVDPMFVEGTAPESVLGRLKPGMKAVATFDGMPGEPFDGVLDRIGPTVDPISKMVRIRVAVPNPALAGGTRRLVPGMSGLIRLVPEQGRYFVMPLNAVRRQEGESMVLLFVGDDSKVTERKVRPLRRDGLRFLVRDGLVEGLRLVIAGPKDLEAGSLVEVANP